MIARDVLLQIAQVLATLLLAPLLQGVILQFEERVQRSQGPGIFQPYRDLWKLFHKQIVAPETASWLYWAAPIVAFTTTLTVPILIPVLTDFPLPLSDMGDILGGGLARKHLYLLEGVPGSGKTTLAMQFLLEGASGPPRAHTDEEAANDSRSCWHHIFSHSFIFRRL